LDLKRDILLQSQRWGASGGDLRVCALYPEDIIPYTINICGPCLEKVVGQSLHITYSVPFSFSVFLIVVSKHSRDFPLGHGPCEFNRDRFRVPRRALTIQLTAGENDKIGSFGIENFRKEGQREVVRAVAWGDGGVATSALGDREV
jgi:hypothetical protein